MTNTLAVETDTALADLYTKESAEQMRAHSDIEALRRTVGQNRDYRTQAWSGSLNEAFVRPTNEWAAREHDRFMASYNGHLATLAEIQTAMAPLTAVYRANGWNRFFLVQDGHIHSSMNCSTCYVTTRFSWLPELSGLTEADAVEAYGEILCSICFPSAPVAWCNGRSKASIAAETAKAAEKAERDAKKAAKQLFADGRSIKVPHDRIATIAAAKMWLTESQTWRDGHLSYPAEAIAEVADALADRLGITAEQVMSDAVRRAKARR
jgi:hypothetical protein